MAIAQMNAPRIDQGRGESLADVFQETGEVTHLQEGLQTQSPDGASNEFSPSSILMLAGRVMIIVGLGLAGLWILLGIGLGWEMPWAVVDVPYTPMAPTAEQYWRNLDIAQVQRDLGGWKREDLARLFIAVQAQAYEPETREHLTALGKVLRLPGFVPDSSLLPTLLGQPSFFVGIFLALGLWFTAAVIGLAPLVRRTVPHQARGDAFAQGDPAAQAFLEELLPDISLETPEAKLDEAKQGEKQEEAKDSSEQEEEASSGLGDLASLFEEEDTSISALEAFCRNLAELGIDNLATQTKDVVRDLRNMLTRTPARKNA